MNMMPLVYIIGSKRVVGLTLEGAEGTAHNLRQHNVLKPSMHDVFRGVMKHFLNARKTRQIGRQGTERDVKGRNCTSRITNSSRRW